MQLRTIQFDPMFVGETDDFTLQWRTGGRPVLGSSETISTATSSAVAGGITITSTSISGTDTTTRINGSAATAGTTARATVTIVTSLGRTLIQPIAFLVQAVPS